MLLHFISLFLYHFLCHRFVLICQPKMELPTHLHPFINLVESNANELKSLLTSYIDATVDSQYNVLKQNIFSVIQSGQIVAPQQSAASDQTLQSIQANVNQSSSHLNSSNNHQLISTTNSPPTQRNFLQNSTSPLNTINKTEPLIKQEFDDDDDYCAEEIDDSAFGQTLLPPIQMIKQEFDDDDNDEENEEEEYYSGEEIDDSNVANCEKCEKGICYSDGENYEDSSFGDDDSETENRDEHFSETRAYVDEASLEENQINQSANFDDDILPSHANQIEPLIEQEYLEDCPNDFGIDQPSSGNVDYDLNDHQNNNNNDLNNDQSIPPTNSEIRSSARKRIPKRAFDYDQLNGETTKRSKTKKRKNVHSKQSKVQLHVPVKKVKPKIVEDNYICNDDREDAKRNQIVTLKLHCTESGCDKIVTSRSLWRQHMERDHQKAPYYQLEDHVRLNDRDQRPEYRCPDAKCKSVKTCKSQESFQDHWRRHHHPGKYKCPTCAFEDNLYYKVQHHLDTTHGAHQCTHNGCGRKFSHFSRLKLHESVHTEYWCVWSGCRWRFKQVLSAKKHVQVTHFKVQQEQNDQNVVDSRDPHEFIVKKVRRLVQGSVD